jgi:bifunctional isochorismate lyase/aryl carrier protein
MTLPAMIDYEPPTAQLPPSRADWRLEAGRAAVLVHDLQRYFVRPYAEDCEALRSAIAATAGLVTAAREVGAPVFYTAQRGDQDPRERGLQQDLWGPGMRAIPEHIEILAEVAPQPGDVVLTKHRYSAFARSDLAERLAAAGRDQLIITGVYAHIGITATALEAFQREVQPFVVADGVADFGEEQHRNALAQIAGCCGAVVLAAEVLAGLRAVAATERPEAAPLIERPETAPPIERPEGVEIGPPAAAPADPNRSDRLIRAAMHGLIDEPQLEAAFAAPDADLFELGLDSLRAFEFLDVLADDGIDIDFGEFVRTPTLNWLRRQTVVEAG